MSARQGTYVFFAFKLCTKLQWNWRCEEAQKPIKAGVLVPESIEGRTLLWWCSPLKWCGPTLSRSYFSNLLHASGHILKGLILNYVCRSQRFYVCCRALKNRSSGKNLCAGHACFFNYGVSLRGFSQKLGISGCLAKSGFYQDQGWSKHRGTHFGTLDMWVPIYGTSRVSEDETPHIISQKTDKTEWKSLLSAIWMTSSSRDIYFHATSRDQTKLWPVEKYWLECPCLRCFW